MFILSERPVLCECAKIVDDYHAAEPIIALFLCTVKGCSFYVQFVTIVTHQNANQGPVCCSKGG